MQRFKRFDIFRIKNEVAILKAYKYFNGEQALDLHIILFIINKLCSFLDTVLLCDI